MDRDLLSKEQWEAWRRQEETLKFLQFLQAQVERVKGDWAEGVFTKSAMSANEIAVANLAAVDNVQFATRIIQMDYEDYKTAMEKD